MPAFLSPVRLESECLVLGVAFRRIYPTALRMLRGCTGWKFCAPKLVLNFPLQSGEEKVSVSASSSSALEVRGNATCAGGRECVLEEKHSAPVYGAAAG